MKSIHAAFILMIVAFVQLLPSVVLADTDGSYCVGQGYVAVEARGLWLKAEKPTVYIAFVGSRGISDRIAMESPSNTDRRIRCDPKKIIMSDGNIIDLANRSKPKVLRVETKSKTGFSRDFLPYIRESKAIPIPSADGRHLYSLVLSYVEQVPPSGGMVLHHVSARVVQSDKFGSLIDARLLAEGIRLETVD